MSSVSALAADERVSVSIAADVSCPFQSQPGPDRGPRPDQILIPSPVTLVEWIPAAQAPRGQASNTQQNASTSSNPGRNAREAGVWQQRSTARSDRSNNVPLLDPAHQQSDPFSVTWQGLGFWPSKHTSSLQSPLPDPELTHSSARLETRC